VGAGFDGGAVTSDAGSLLLRETDRRLNLLPRLAGCFLDGRQPLLVKHSVEEMVSQRVYGLALGYEDLNDPIGGKGYVFRGPTSGAAGKVFQVCGVAMPPTLRPC